jgi:hypothetical protein
MATAKRLIDDVNVRELRDYILPLSLRGMRPMTRALKIAARPAIFVVSELRRRGVPTDDLLKQVALRRSDLTDPEARVPYSAVLGLIERAAAVTGDASFGLRLGASRNQRDSGLLGFVLLTHPRSWMRSAISSATSEWWARARSSRSSVAGPT